MDKWLQKDDMQYFCRLYGYRRINENGMYIQELLTDKKEANIDKILNTIGDHSSH